MKRIMFSLLLALVLLADCGEDEYSKPHRTEGDTSGRGSPRMEVYPNN